MTTHDNRLEIRLVAELIAGQEGQASAAVRNSKARLARYAKRSQMTLPSTEREER